MVFISADFDPEKRICSSNCPACIVAPHLAGRKENFTQPQDLLTGLTDNEQEAIGLCMVAGTGTEVALGEECSFTDEDYGRFVARTVTRLALKGKIGITLRS